MHIHLINTHTKYLHYIQQKTEFIEEMSASVQMNELHYKTINIFFNDAQVPKLDCMYLKKKKKQHISECNLY